MYADQAESLALNIRDGTSCPAARAEQLAEDVWGVAVEIDDQTPVRVRGHGRFGYRITAPGCEDLLVDSFPALRAALIAMRAGTGRRSSP